MVRLGQDSVNQCGSSSEGRLGAQVTRVREREAEREGGSARACVCEYMRACPCVTGIDATRGDDAVCSAGPEMIVG